MRIFQSQFIRFIYFPFHDTICIVSRVQHHTWGTITQTLLAALTKSMPQLASLTVRFDESDVVFASSPAFDEVEDGDLIDLILRFQ